MTWLPGLDPLGPPVVWACSHGLSLGILAGFGFCDNTWTILEYLSSGLEGADVSILG